MIDYPTCPDDVPEFAFKEMMKEVPPSAKFLEHRVTKSECYPQPWWREFHFQLTESYGLGKKGDRIMLDCPLKIVPYD